MKRNQDEIGFLRAIWDQPADNAPRLVYADWLQEHGRDWEADAVRYFCSLKEPERMFLREQVIGYPQDHKRHLKQFSTELVFGALNEHLLALHGHRFKFLARLARYAREYVDHLQVSES
jgi:uncharacterized protein (TIGR02996 family)